jgi:hypothetical protein
METIAIPGAEIYYEKNLPSAEKAAVLLDAREAKCLGNGIGLHSNTLFRVTKPTTATPEPGIPIRDASTGHLLGFPNCSR